MKLLLVHGDLDAGGGAEAYALAIRDWLAGRGHQADTLDIHGLVAGRRFERPSLLLAGGLPGLRRLHLFRYALVCRVLPRLARGYDRVIFTYGEGPAVGCPTLTLRHAPALFSARARAVDALGAEGRGTIYRGLRQVYALAARRLAGMPPGPRMGPILANSAWTAARIPDAAGSCDILYPKLVPLPPRPGARGRFRILALGRMVPGKRLDEAIAITAALRLGGLAAEIDIAGRAEGSHARRLMRRHAGRSFVRFHPDAGPARVAQLIAGARFGLHCYRHEHFGIAVAEMIAGGVVPLVWDGGGVCELVPDAALRFAGPGEAAEKLGALMRSPREATDALAARLAEGAAFRAALDFDRQLEASLTRHLGAA